MKHVEQVDRSGCGIACVAMVTGKTYEEVRHIWLTKCDGEEELLTATGNAAGITNKQIERLLKACGAKNIQVIPFHNPLIRSVPGSYGMSHWVVIDGDGDKLDPADTEAKKIKDLELRIASLIGERNNLRDQLLHAQHAQQEKSARTYSVSHYDDDCGSYPG